MDKILSARISESVVRQIGILAQELHVTKKAVIEAAIAEYAEKVQAGGKMDVLEKTLGAWQRKETPEKTLEKARREFRKSMTRHYR